MLVKNKAAATTASRPSALKYSEVISEAVNGLKADCAESGTTKVLDIPSDEPTLLGLYQRIWTPGSKIDGYSFIAGSIVNALVERIPESTEDNDELIIRQDVRGTYGQLGASILLRCLQKATSTYLEAIADPDLDEFERIVKDSFGELVPPLAKQHNSVGSRLEILYGMSERGNGLYDNYAASVTQRHELALLSDPEPKIILADFRYAMLDAARFSGLDPAIPEHPVGICPLESPRTKNEAQITSLNVLWNIAITACIETPWMWPKEFKTAVDQAKERS